jgi:hypothetical protein
VARVYHNRWKDLKPKQLVSEAVRTALARCHKADHTSSIHSTAGQHSSGTALNGGSAHALCAALPPNPVLGRGVTQAVEAQQSAHTFGKLVAHQHSRCANRMQARWVRSRPRA